MTQDNLRHAQYGNTGKQIDAPQDVYATSPEDPVLTLNRITTTANSVLDQLPDGKYIGTSVDAAGGFGGQIWTATGALAALSKTGLTATNTASLLNAAGGAVGGGGTIAGAWATPDNNLFFATNASNGKCYLYYAKNTAGTWTVGNNAGTYDNLRAVLDVGLRSGTQPAEIRTLHSRSLCIVNIAGTNYAMLGEYNVAAGRVPGSTNDQVRTWRAALAAPETWTVINEWNTNGTTSQVRHIHGIVQDPVTKFIYILIGDDPLSGIIKWDGVSAAPAANTSLANYNLTPGWQALTDTVNPDFYRSGDLIFGGDIGAYLTDRSDSKVFWPSTCVTRTGRMSALRGRQVEMLPVRDPLIGLTLPGGGGLWISLWDTSALGSARRGYDVWMSPTLKTWTKVGTIPDVGTSGSVGVIFNLFLSSENSIVISVLSGSAKLAANSFGGSIVCNLIPWQGNSASEI